MAKAENMASIPRDNPEIKSPDMVSLRALVMDTPGTRDIIEPIIIVSILWPKPILTTIIDNTDAMEAPIRLLIKKSHFILTNLSHCKQHCYTD